MSRSVTARGSRLQSVSSRATKALELRPCTRAREFEHVAGAAQRHEIVAVALLDRPLDDDEQAFRRAAAAR